MPRLYLLMLILLLSVPAKAAERPNVLFIAVDDLRPELGCYGKEHIHSPNIDRLADGGVLFERAYCMVPTCGASRASLMTGIRPSRNRFVHWQASAEKEAPGITTLNTHFLRNGYHTVSLGKVFNNLDDSTHGWSEPAWRPEHRWYHHPENLKRHEEQQKRGSRYRGPAWESADVPDETFRDGRLAQRALADLRRLKEKNEPFLLAVGFFKPHLPFVAPKKYWDLYDDETIQLPDNYHVPQDAPKESIHTWGELRAYAGIPASGPVSDETARNLIHGYYACVSYIDAQVGLLLDELDRLELADETIVVLWGDHGWNLGEHTLWCKHSCYETSMHIPLIVKAPGFSGGERRDGLIESIDIYPSLCELTNLPLPDRFKRFVDDPSRDSRSSRHEDGFLSEPAEPDLQGRSFATLMKDPQAEWKSSAVGRYGNGDTIRTDRFRFSEYTNAAGRQLSRMLYDHESDPGENVNVTETHKEIVADLTEQLHELMGRDGKLGDSSSPQP